MCGRYNIITDPQALIDGFSVAISSINSDALQSITECFPGMDLPVIRQTNAGRELLFMRWGLVPHCSKTEKTKYSTINAKAETLMEKPTYREPFLHKRCIIPAKGFFEWCGPKGKKQKYYISDKNNLLIAFAGLWDCWRSEDKQVESFTIVTTDSNKEVSAIHERMPVILEQSQIEQWLNEDTAAPEENLSLLKPAQEGRFKIDKV